MTGPGPIRFALAVSAASAATLCGCYSQYNDTPRIGGVVDVHDVDPATPKVPAKGRASVMTIDRDRWPAQVFFVPDSAVVTAPAYAPLRGWTGASARQRGEAPGTIDAVTVDTEEDETLEALLIPLATLYDLVAIVPRAFLCTWPTTPTVNPRASYERSPSRWADGPPQTGTGASPEAAERADREFRERFGEALLLDARERRPTPAPAPRETTGGVSG